MSKYIIIKNLDQLIKREEFLVNNLSSVLKGNTWLFSYITQLMSKNIIIKNLD